MGIVTISEGVLAAPAALGTSSRGSGHSMLTYRDAIDLGVSFLLGHGGEASQEAVRHAVHAAYLDIISGYNWPSLELPGRIHLHAAQATGTITYTHSTRSLVLNGATWPDWVEDGTIRIDDVLCEVESYVNSTTLRLDSTLNPGVNVAAGTGYSLFCRWYPLPAEFVNFTGPMGRNSWAYGQQIGMAEMTAYQRNHNSTGTIRYYAIGERPNSPAEKALYVWPFAPTTETLDFTFQRRPRELLYTGHDAADMVGTITVIANTNTITGVSTTFDSEMVGALVLVGRDASSVPTGRYGLNRFSEQLRVQSYTSATVLTATSNAVTSRAAVKYVVTDPIDIETCAQNAFLRYMEMHLALNRNFKEADKHVVLAEKAMRDAMAASYPTRFDSTQGTMGQGWPESNTIPTTSWGLP
jgi:hypothetical protein